jgi:hypothetical protein
LASWELLRCGRLSCVVCQTSCGDLGTTWFPLILLNLMFLYRFIYLFVYL